jgi:competence protein ComEC
MPNARPQKAIGQVPRRPAVPAAVALIVGIFLHESLPAWPVVWISVLAALIAASIVSFRRAWLCTLTILSGTIVAGAVLTQSVDCFYARNHISAFATDQQRLAQMEMRLDHPPRDLTWPFGQNRATPPKQVATASVTKIRTKAGWVDCRGSVLVQISQPHPRIGQGQTLRVIGTLQRPGPAMNPGQFDWASYYREQRILASVQIAQADAITIVDQGSIGPVSWLRQRGQAVAGAGI